MATIRKSWDDYLLFYGTEVLAVLICEGVIIYFTWEGITSLPYCIGLLITALVAFIAMHWALTKYCKGMIIAGYFVWLGITLCVGITAGVLFMAYDREKKHDKALTQRLEKLKTEAKIEKDKQDQNVKNDLTAKLTLIEQINGMLQGKNQRDRTGVLKLGQELVKATPTPLPPASERVAVALGEKKPAEPEEPALPEEWKPFAKGSFLEFWHEDVTRLNGIIGLLGFAVLLGVYLPNRNKEAALQTVNAGATTVHTVTTNGSNHQTPQAQTPGTQLPNSPATQQP